MIDDGVVFDYYVFGFVGGVGGIDYVGCICWFG